MVHNVKASAMDYKDKLEIAENFRNKFLIP